LKLDTGKFSQNRNEPNSDAGGYAPAKVDF
jgi:hypothetical protein